MAVVFREIRPAPDARRLNEEWIVIENTGAVPLGARGCTLALSRGRGAARGLGRLDPGFALPPGGRIRIVSGCAGRPSQGRPPDETPDLSNYYLMRRAPLGLSPGATLHLRANQVDLARGVYDPEAPGGVGG